MGPVTAGSRVMITGARGQLASAIRDVFDDRSVVAHTRESLDITSGTAVARAVELASPRVIVNCAAFNNVDGAEDAPAEAFAINAFAVRGLARAAERAGATLVHFSTDFVFAGTDPAEPHTEETPPSPRSTYAMSKLLGEWFALDAPGSFAVRVESLFGVPREWSGRRGTLDAIVDGLEQGREVRVFTDRVVSPSFIHDVARAVRHLVESGAAPGLYHCVNSGSATWREVAEEAARLLGVKPRLQLMTLDQMPLKAPRPRYCALSNRKLAAAGYSMPTWQDALRRWLEARRHIE